MMEPEYTGPKDGKHLPSSTAFCVRPLATPGLVWVSEVVDTIFLPMHAASGVDLFDWPAPPRF